MRRDVYSGKLRLYGASDGNTLVEAYNYATSLATLNRFKEIKALLFKAIPVARRTLGENHEITLKMRKIYAEALYCDTDATLDDIREAVTMFEDIEPSARRVFGGAHPLKVEIERELRRSRAKLRARETPPTKGES